jgi:N-acetylneuraminic acid mutarotase
VAGASAEAHNGRTMHAERSVRDAHELKTTPRSARTKIAGRNPLIAAAVAVAVAGAVAAAGSLAAASAPGAWRQAAPLADPRGEVAAAVVDGEIAVVGGFDRNGSDSARVDLYSPARDAWRRLPDLPVAVDHAMAAAADRRLYVLGGYGRSRAPRRSAWTLTPGGRWRALPPLPAARAAGGAAILDGRLYVVGGVGPRGLARQTLVLDLRRRRWSRIPGPWPREHLAVTAAAGKVYAVAGRKAGFDTNTTIFESLTPPSRRWRALPPVPSGRGGTGAAVVGTTLVSVGGEAPQGTIRTVFGFDLRSRAWRRLPDLPTPRHGLAVAAARGRVYVIAGGTTPGLATSGANEFLALPR